MEGMQRPHNRISWERLQQKHTLGAPETFHLMERLRRFWFPARRPALLGVGVTAFSRVEAEGMARQVAAELHYELEGDPIEDVDIRTLEANHVLPNIGVVSWRGVWYPARFQLRRAGT